MHSNNLNHDSLSGVGFNDSVLGGEKLAWEKQIALAIRNLREAVLLVRGDLVTTPGGTVSAGVLTSADAELDKAAAIITQAITDLAGFGA